MKTKLAAANFWGIILFMTPTIVCGIAFGLYFLVTTHQIFYAIFIFLPLWMLYYVWKRRINYFSVIEILNSGIVVSCFGNVWFQGRWDEIPYLGNFETGSGRTFTQYKYFYFSLIPIDDWKFVLRGDGPSNWRMEGNTAFLMLTPKIYDEILKYVDKERIIQHGVVSSF